MAVSVATILDHVRRTFEGLEFVEALDTHFVFYDPEHDTPHDRRQPFLTIVTSDANDPASDLARRGAYRVNVGVARETYRRMFGREPAWNLDGGPVATGHDFTTVDEIMPHPVYAPLAWVCVVDPSAQTWERLKPMLAEAHALAQERHARRGPRGVA